MKRSARTMALAASILVAACNPQPPKATPSPSPASSQQPRRSAPPIALEITGEGTATRPVHLIQQVHNRVDYDLLASSYESKGPSGSARAVFHDARVTFHDRRGSTIAATAPRAVVDETANTVTLTDGVHARTASGMTLQCTQLVYQRPSGVLRGNGHVVITDAKGFRATGTSFVSDSTLTNIRMQ